MLDALNQTHDSIHFTDDDYQKLYYSYRYKLLDALAQKQKESDIRITSEMLRGFLELPEEEMAELMSLTSDIPIASGHIHIKAICRLSGVPKEDRASVLELALHFFDEPANFRGNYKGLPSMIKILAFTPASERSDILSLVLPFAKFWNPERRLDCLVLSTAEVIATPVLRRHAVMSQLWSLAADFSGLLQIHRRLNWTSSAKTFKALIAEISSAPEERTESMLNHVRDFAKQVLEGCPCLDRPSGLRGANECAVCGSHKDLLLEIILTLKEIPNEEWACIYDGTIGSLLKYSQSLPRVLRSVQIVAEMPGSARLELIQQAREVLDADRDMLCDYILQALAKVPSKERKELAARALALKQKFGKIGAEGFSLILGSLSELGLEDRNDIAVLCLTLPGSIVDYWNLSSAIKNLARVPANERPLLIEMVRIIERDYPAQIPALEWVGAFLSNLIEAPADGRGSLFHCLRSSFKWKTLKGLSKMIRALGEVSPDQRMAFVKEARDFLSKENIANEETVFIALAKLPPGERRNITGLIAATKATSSYGCNRKLIESLSKVPIEERRDILCSACSMGKVHQNLSSKCPGVIGALAAIDSSERAIVLKQIRCFFKYIGPHHCATVLHLLEGMQPEHRESFIAQACLLLSRKPDCLESATAEENVYIIEEIAAISHEDRRDVVHNTLQLCASCRWSGKETTASDSAPEVKLLLYPIVLILRILAQVSDKERSSLVDLASNFQIKELGLGYAALVVIELAGIPEGKRNRAMMACELGDKVLLEYDKEEAGKQLRAGFDAYVEYLTKATNGELFRLKLIAANANIPEHAKEKFQKYAGPIFLAIPESELGDLITWIAFQFKPKP